VSVDATMCAVPSLSSVTLPAARGRRAKGLAAERRRPPPWSRAGGRVECGTQGGEGTGWEEGRVQDPTEAISARGR